MKKCVKTHFSLTFHLPYSCLNILFHNINYFAQRHRERKRGFWQKKAIALWLIALDHVVWLNRIKNDWTNKLRYMKEKQHL